MMNKTSFLLALFFLFLVVGLSSCGNSNEIRRLKAENDSLRSVIDDYKQEAEKMTNLAEAQADSARAARERAIENFQKAQKQTQEAKENN